MPQGDAKRIQTVAGLEQMLVKGRASAPAPAKGTGRIFLIRHGRPAIAIAPRTCHRGFGAYIGDYERAGLDPESLPPAQLCASVAGLNCVFTSDKPRAHQSARLLLPAAEQIADPLFAEAPLAAPRIPFLRMRVTKWAVIARLLWHAGFHPAIEDQACARRRAAAAAAILIARLECDSAVALVAHGYFNFLIGRELARRGFVRRGLHRARFWNAITYEKGT
jgi:broad specificity phosphatase PhoE